jgi:hypothetical protein
MKDGECNFAGPHHALCFPGAVRNEPGKTILFEVAF